MRVEMHLYCKWGVGGWDGNDTFLIPRDAVFTFSTVLCRRESSAAKRGKGIFAFIKKKLSNLLHFFHFMLFFFEPQWKEWGGFLGPGYSNAAWFLLVIVPKKDMVD